MREIVRIYLAAIVLMAASLPLGGCFLTGGQSSLQGIMKHCTAYGPLRYGAGGLGFGAAFACDASTAHALKPR